MYRKLRFDNEIKAGIAKLDGPWSLGESGRWKPANPKGARGSPWIYTNIASRKKFCHVWNHNFYGQFNHIPSYCRFQCWKVVIKPRNVKEVFECYDIMNQMMLPGKIGIDLRDYTFGAWAGFFYNETLEQGREVYAIARELIDDDIPVILKRGCTEMERGTPSHLWDLVSKEFHEKEQYLNDLIEFEELHFVQAEWLKNEIKERWIGHAIRLGDPTAREMAEKYCDDPDIWAKLVVLSETYHDSDPRDALREKVEAKLEELKSQD